MLGRPLSRAEHRALLGEAKCSVCVRTRAQLARKAGTATAPNAAPSAGAAGGGAAGNGDGDGSTKATAAAEAWAAGNKDGASGGDGGKAAADKASEPAMDVAGAKDATTTPAPAPAGSSAAAADPATAAASTAAATAASAAGSPLTCCPHCHWGWVCGEHRDAYLSGPHAVVCLPYRHMNESQLLTQRYLTATGRVPNYVPDTPRRPTTLPPEAAKVVATAAAAKGRAAEAAGGCAAGADSSSGGSGSGSGSGSSGGGGWEPVPAGGWAAFQGWRPLPVFDQALMCLLTKRVSQALTVIQVRPTR